MILYAHRGNLSGPEPTLENHPDYIDKAIAAGFHAEVDLRMDHTQTLHLGHDRAQYPVTPEWLASRGDRLLIHVKDKDSLHFMLSPVLGLFPGHPRMHYFCHQDDHFVLTSLSYVWLHDYKDDDHHDCIVPLITRADIFDYPRIHQPHGICSDHVVFAQERLKDG